MSAPTTGHCPLPSVAAGIEPAVRRDGPARLIFAVTALLVGFVPAVAAFALNPHAASDIGLTAIPVPAWVFVVVWLIIYPSMGVAAAHLWANRGGLDVCVPLAVLVAGLLQSTSFWFTDSLHATAVTDATGILLAATTVWVVSRYSSTAARWLIPWLTWMPITFAIKVAVVSGIL